MSHPRYNTFLKINRKLRAIKYKGGKCIKCSYDKWYGTLEFHHRDPSKKEFNWQDCDNQSWDTVTRELDKCDLLCANCHREEHADWELLLEYRVWRKEVDSRKILLRVCPVCQNEFKPKLNRVTCCSVACSSANRTKVNWPANLPELVAASSKRTVGVQLGVSDKAVAKRLRKHHAPIV